VHWLARSRMRRRGIYDPNHVREGYIAADLKRMLSDRGLGVVEVAYCMHGCFKLVLRGWNRFGPASRLLRILAVTDRIWHIGTPMDLSSCRNFRRQRNAINSPRR
jgi:hypothetical protein